MKTRNLSKLQLSKEVVVLLNDMQTGLRGGASSMRPKITDTGLGYQTVGGQHCDGTQSVGCPQKN